MSSTIRDVVKLSGLSLGTVSKYINGQTIKEKNKILIENAIKELDYKPNNIAKGLRNSKTYSVAILLPMLTSNFCTSIVSSIEAYLLPKGYTIIVCECHNDADMELKKAKFLLERMIDGIILIPFDNTGKQIDLIKNSNTPLVVVDQIIENKIIDSIVLDNTKSVYEPIKKLISLGHTKIAFIAGNYEHYTSITRLNGYKKAMLEAELEIPDEYIQYGFYSSEGGYEAMIKLANLKNRPSAVFISNYDMVVGAYIAINNLNLQIPKDFSVIGFDDLPLVNIVKPKLSFVEQPIDEMGKNAAKLLYKRMQGNLDNYPHTVLHKPKFYYTPSISKI